MGVYNCGKRASSGTTHPKNHRDTYSLYFYRQRSADLMGFVVHVFLQGRRLWSGWACIDENLEVVRFLVEQGATVNQADNEGWTPLHVAASCGYLDIARYLLSHGADIAAVNSDGDLPLDLAESDAMEGLLKAEIAYRGVDVEAAKRAEEELLLRDTRCWLNGGAMPEARHPRTGASALHVAAAKGYIEVMRLLLQAGYDPELRDGDGWTPLHAAAHWGVEDACRLLAEHGGGMDSLTHAGQRPCDLADEEVLSLLEELARKQEDLRNQKEASQSRSQEPQVPSSGKHRRSSVCRLSSREKISLQDLSKERRPGGAGGPPIHDEDEGEEGPTGGVTLTDLKEAEKAAGKTPEPEKSCLDPSRRPRVPGVENSDGPALRAEAPDGQGQGPQAAREHRKVGKEWRGPAEGEEAEPADRSPESSTSEGGPSPRSQRQRDSQPESDEPDGGFRKLYAGLRSENERLREALTETTLRLAQLKVELERATQRQERFAERPALLELERFERRALERKAAELEEELKALSDLRADNQRLKDENAALIRVISKLSK
ncbi:protein phosphatase 1 regulatory subunit 12C [Puma concolor]|uniref:Protein phosphatase 1 regulatory subunit 12C n=1 Tax=Puma concolor TaxID=9696 RepID=A0A6P6H3U4_PUMCO|nr:protein phosphatase 1 regulatory subunit 12C [Puma concolor]